MTCWVSRWLWIALLWPTGWVIAQPKASPDKVFPVSTAPLENTVLVDDLPHDFPHTELKPIMMWRADRDGRTTYLIGSLHMATEDIYPLPEAMMKAFDQSAMIIFEVDPDTLNEAFQKKFLAAGQLPPQQTLFDLISPDVKTKLEAALKRNAIPRNAVASQKPWYTAVVLTFSEMMRQAGNAFSINHGIDRYFAGEAKTRTKLIRGLETADDQLALFANIPDALSQEFLEKTLDELSQLGPLYTRMIAAWKNGASDALWTIVKESFDPYPGIYEEWLVARNVKWLDAIERYHRKNKVVLIVVGAAHMIGPDGLPVLLQRRGFEVNQMHQPAASALSPSP